MYQKILLPTDGSEQAEKAGEYAISTADFTGADIIVLYVIDTSKGDWMKKGYVDAIPQPDLREQLDKQLREEGKKAVEDFKKKLEETQCAGKCTNVNLETMIKEGNPAEVILKTMKEEDIDVVVIGKSGKHGLEKFVLGNTAEKVVGGATVQVNVIS